MYSLIILRGLPGSGKSTLAGILADGQWPILSIDSYFTDKETGKYSFRFNENHLAYSRCIDDTEQFMRAKKKKIFLDNTFTLEWEMEPYFELAKKHSYQIFILTVENRHNGKNTHGISEEQLQRMAEKYKIVLM